MQTSSSFETHPDKTALKMKVLVADLQRRIDMMETDKAALNMNVLVAHLQRRIDMMEPDLAHEEERTRVQDVAHPTYSILARNLRGRRDNLLATIAILKRRLD